VTQRRRPVRAATSRRMRSLPMTCATGQGRVVTWSGDCCALANDLSEKKDVAGKVIAVGFRRGSDSVAGVWWGDRGAGVSHKWR
jgi:hypothetical protein